MASTTPVIFTLASPMIFVMIRTCTTAPATATMIPFPPAVPIMIISIPTSAATSPSIIPVPVLIAIPGNVFN